MNETCSWNSAWCFKISILLNNTFITWGIIPVWQPSLQPVPMVYVFPEPVCSTFEMSKLKTISELRNLCGQFQCNFCMQHRGLIWMILMSEQKGENAKLYLTICQNRSIISLKQTINKWCNAFFKHGWWWRATISIDMIKSERMCSYLDLHHSHN